MRSGRTAILIGVLALLVSTRAGATQHLVSPGDDWSQLSRVVRAGDEIILMPGVHRPAKLVGLKGTRQRRIVIRGARSDATSVIKARRFGLILEDVSHIEIRDLVIDGATICGLRVSGPAGEYSTNVLMRNVRVERTGPRGQRHGVLLERLKNVRILDCDVTGWGESGMEVVACDSVTINSTSFKGLEDYSQISGIRVRAGTQSVQIIDCRFTNAGDQGVCIGADSALEDFVAPLEANAEPGTLFEATNVTVNRSVFRGGMCAVGIVSGRQAHVQQCTIIDPKHAIMSYRSEKSDARFGVVAGSTFTQNLVIWRAGGLTRITHLIGGADPGGMMLQENAWWTPDWETSRDRLGGWPGTILNDAVQHTIDPQLDEDNRPRAAALQAFGARESARIVGERPE